MIQIPGEQPRPIDIAVFRKIREANLCAWCFEPLGARRAEFNGGVGHLACAMFANHAVLGTAGDPVMPWIPGVDAYRDDPLLPFCERLGREGRRLGIDMQKLAKAIAGACHG
jgi:hypothetical protein